MWTSRPSNSARWCFGAGHSRAQAAGTALLPSAAFFSAVADVLAEQADADIGPAIELQVAYWVDNWRPIGSSLSSRFEGIGQEWFEHDRGAPRVRRSHPRTSFFHFPSPVGTQRVGSYPISEVFVIPWHLDLDRFTSNLTTSTLGPAALGRFQPAVANAVGALMRTPARPLVERGIAALWRATSEGIAEGDPTRFMVAVEAHGEAGRVQHWLRGRGIYDITAPIAAETALRTSSDDFRSVGTIPPSQVLDLGWMLANLKEFDLEYGMVDGRVGADR